MPRIKSTAGRPILAGFGLLACLALPLGAAAQDTAETSDWAPREPPERPHLPGWSSAGDDGAASIWSNPANLALDPDPSWMVLVTQQADAPVDQGRSVGFAANLGPLGTGIHTTEGAAGEEWWTVSSSLAMRLERTLTLGGHLGWQLPEGPDNNFLTGDLSLSWRPTPWIGTSVAAWNVGRWDTDVATATFVPSVVLRPWDDNLFLGVDYELPWLSVDEAIIRGNLRVQAGSGWVVRLSGDQTGRVGAGIELYWGAAGIGGYGEGSAVGDSEVLATLYARSSTGSRDRIALGPRVAHFRLDQSYPYREGSGFFGPSGETYLHLLARLDAAAQDDSLQGVLIEMEYAPFSLAQIEEVRSRIAAMRDAGKKVVVYLDKYPGNAEYLLASAADEVFMHPAGDLELIGLSAEMQYYRGVLDRVGVTPQVARRSEYKSAPEGLMNTEGSEPSREQMNALLDDLAANLSSAIAHDHGWNPDDVQALIDGGPYTADDALEKRLVDGLVYPDELSDQLDRLFTDSHQLEDDYGNDRDTPGWRPRREIAVITIDGAIVTGQSGGPGFFGGGYTAGADTIVSQLDAAGGADVIKAVVLRVDSPGGSSFASDEIWRAVQRVQDAGKPVVVSMGSVAASGGYYVAAGAESIFANPSTITGSIGVYAGPMLSFADLYDKVGVGTELYARGRHAAMYSSSKPMDDQEFAALDRMVGHTYAQFKQRVATGRGLSDEQVESVARGRVWSGLDAQDGELVDELGGFHEALAAAISAAGLSEEDDVSVVTLDTRPGPAGIDVISRPLASGTPRSVLRELTARLPTKSVPEPLAALEGVPGLAELERWQALEDEHVLALMPYIIRIR